MATATLLQRESINVIDYRCEAGPDDRPFPEAHGSYSLSFVRRGSFGCRIGNHSLEFVAGSIFLGHPGGEYLCTHEHHDRGDECLSFRFAEEWVDVLAGNRRALWRTGRITPLPQLVVAGELAQAAASGDADIALDEAGLLLAAKFIDVVSGEARPRTHVRTEARRRIIEVALWIDENSHSDIDLEQAARQTGLSAFHFLRLFGNVIGITPHQYLLRSRLRRASRLLAEHERQITDIALDVGFNDLSNFVRTFHRAAGVSPRDFRRASRGDRAAIQTMLESVTLS